MKDMEVRAKEHDASLPTVSVIIPTFNDVERLATCLRLLSQQDYPAELFDVIVVDNASTEDLRRALPDDPRFQLVYEGKRGSYAARNAGVEVATSEILAFTDSDCLPRHDWLSEGVRALCATPPPDAIGGPITMVFQDGKAARSAPELYDAMEGFPQDEFIRIFPFAATGNMMVGRDTFNAVGPFNSELASGGDREWGVRLAATGRIFAYAPQAVVDHPSRASWRELTTKSIRVAKGMAEFLTAEPWREVVAVLRLEAEGTWLVWRDVWNQPEPPGGWAKVKFATAFSYVHAIRFPIMASHLLRRDVRARRRRLAAANGEPDRDTEATQAASRVRGAAISVVIPAYNAAHTLGDQLDALAHQELGVPFEVIVCDNGSTDATAAVVQSRWESMPALRLVDASARRGPAAARNVGVAQATSPLIVFCDADDIVGEGWLPAMYAALQDSPFVVGRTDGDRLNSANRASLNWTQEAYWNHWVWPDLMAASSNTMGIHRTVFEEVGGFEESLRTCEDIDLSWRVQLAGYPLTYQPEAVLHTRKRDGLRAIFSQYYAYGRGDRLLHYRYSEVLSQVRTNKQIETGRHATQGAATEQRAMRDRARELTTRALGLPEKVRTQGFRGALADRARRLGKGLGYRFGRLDTDIPQVAASEVSPAQRTHT